VSDADARTPLYPEHRALGGRMVSFAGWEMPIQYAGLTREHQAVRSAVGLFDVSHMGRLSFRGADAVALVDRLITNDLSRIALGQAVYTCACNEQGGILDDLIVYRLQPAHGPQARTASSTTSANVRGSSPCRGRTRWS
jgi:aminomethyltransferase